MPFFEGVVAAIWLIGTVNGVVFIAKPPAGLWIASTRLRAISFTFACCFVPLILIGLMHGSSANGDDSAPRAFGFFLVIAMTAFCVVQLGKARRLQKENAEKSATNAALALFLSDLRRTYAFIFDTSTGNYLCMDEGGELLHFMQLKITNGEASVERELKVKVTDVVSVEAVLRERTEIETVTETKRKGALTRAVVGDVFFGPAGAIVGATSAGSQSTSVGVQRKVYESSELVFGLSDLRNPVVRFVCYDHSKADEWLHRVRSAMSRASASR